MTSGDPHKQRRTALVCLYQVREKLTSAKKWEYLEAVGRGLFSMGARHSHMIEANRALERAAKQVRILADLLDHTPGHRWGEGEREALLALNDAQLNIHQAEAAMPSEIEQMQERLQRVIGAVNGLRGVAERAGDLR